MNKEQVLCQQAQRGSADPAASARAITAPEMTLLLLISWSDRLTLCPRDPEDRSDMVAAMRDLERRGYVRFVPPVSQSPSDEGDPDANGVVWEVTDEGRAVAKARRTDIRRNALCGRY